MKKLSLTSWIFIAMFAGIALGHFFPEAGKSIALVGTVFLRLIKSIIAPLLFATLVFGIAGSGSAKAMGRIGLKSIIYFEIVTTIALFLGLGAVHLLKPGVGVALDKGVESGVGGAQTSLAGVLEHTFPASVIDAMAKNEVLQLVVFCFLFGTACIAIGEKAKPVVDFCQSLSEVMFQYTRYVMYFAPFGVGAAIAAVVGSKGIGVMVGLGKLVFTLYVALAVFVVFVLGAVMLIFRIPVKRFWQQAKEPFVLALTTASSEAALPSAFRNMERLGVPKHIVSFVLPTGYSFNLDGTTLYLSVAAIFLAQAAGMDMPISQQLLMMLTLMLTSKGVAGVPRAALVILTGTVASFGLPAEGIALLLGIDTLLDMARTSVNVLGNCLATTVIAKWEGYELTPQSEGEPVLAGTE